MRRMLIRARAEGAAGRSQGGRTTRTRLVLLAVAVATCVAALAMPAVASPRLRVVDLGTLDGQCCSQATAINDRGDVVGDSNVAPVMSARHAFLWRDGQMTDLGTLGGLNSTATDINNRGDVVGVSDLADGTTHAFLWRDGRMIDLGTLGGDNSYAMAINDVGEVVGHSAITPGDFRAHAFLWRGGTMIDLGTLAGGSAGAQDINERGQVAGESTVDGMNPVPVRWQGPGLPTALSERPGLATAINERGQTVGYSFGDGSFLWSHGQLVDLGTLPDASFVQAFGINDRGVVVGYTDFDAFRWHRGRMTALPRLVGSTTGAHDINNRGQIVGYSATKQDGTDYHAVLWTR